MKKNKESQFHEYLKFATYITSEEIEAMHMVDISPAVTGISGVYLWAGENPHADFNRIKVSNLPNAFSRDDCFTITLPDLKIIGQPNNELITNEIMIDIIKFLKLNMILICDYSDQKIATDIFFNRIVKI